MIAQSHKEGESTTLIRVYSNFDWEISCSFTIENELTK